jgi:hypothetical protein
MLGIAALLATSIQGVSADIKSDADTILNWAEKTFPTLLPPTQPTQSLDTWLFRAYLSTDFYTGINSRDNGVYYITGDALRKGGNPIYFDSVSNALKQATVGNSTAKACG